MKDVEIIENKVENTVAFISDVEVAVLQHLADGLTVKEVAAKMYVSPRTIDSHVSKILKKTEAKKIIQVIIALYKKGIIA